jgi:hypothetical protein
MGIARSIERIFHPEYKGSRLHRKELSTMKIGEPG